MRDFQIILTEADGFLSAPVLYIRMGFDLSEIDSDDIRGNFFPH
jgi:hypothetical protein